MEAIHLPEEGLQMKKNRLTVGEKRIQFDALLNMSKSISSNLFCVTLGGLEGHLFCQQPAKVSCAQDIWKMIKKEGKEGEKNML